VRRFDLGAGSRKKNSITKKVTRVLYFPYFSMGLTTVQRYCAACDVGSNNFQDGVGAK